MGQAATERQGADVMT